MRRGGLLLIGLAIAAAGAGLHRWRVALVLGGEPLPVVFDHGDHRSVNCAHCHHNFIDDSGRGLCYACHRGERALALAMQSTFHDLCRGCHVGEARAGRDAGPLRRCSDCHRRRGEHAEPQRR